MIDDILWSMTNGGEETVSVNRRHARRRGRKRFHQLLTTLMLALRSWPF